jgi:hypothetical protein
VNINGEQIGMAGSWPGLGCLRKICRRLPILPVAVPDEIAKAAEQNPTCLKNSSYGNAHV